MHLTDQILRNEFGNLILIVAFNIYHDDMTTEKLDGSCLLSKCKTKLFNYFKSSLIKIKPLTL